MVFGRLRAAMMRAGKKPDYRVLQDLLAKQKEMQVGRQTVHNWFRPACQFIEPKYLFAIAEILDVSAQWLATGEGNMNRPIQLGDDLTQLVGLYESFPDPDARAKWFRDALKDGNELLALLDAASKASPYARVK